MAAACATGRLSFDEAVRVHLPGGELTIVVPRGELTVALFQRQATPFDRALDTHICNLRKKLGPGGDAIGTVRSVGYLLRVTDDGPDGRD